jgi:membrane protein YdbS with pleckstrin-like domain
MLSNLKSKVVRRMTVFDLLVLICQIGLVVAMSYGILFASPQVEKIINWVAWGAIIAYICIRFFVLKDDYKKHSWEKDFWDYE